MKTIRNRILSGMMAIMLVVSLLAVAPVSTFAETQYVKTYTQSYTLKEGQMYSIPLKMKQNADLTVQITIIDGKSGKRMFVVPQLWEDYKMEEGCSSSDKTLGLGPDMVDKVTIKGKALKGSKSALSFGVGFSDENSGGDVKVRVKITSEKKCFVTKKLVQETSEE